MTAPALPNRADAATCRAAGRQAHNAGDLAAAATGYRQALALAPADADSLGLLGVLCQQTGRPAEAQALTGRAVRLRPDSAGLLNAYGHVLLANGRFDQAIPPLQAAVAADPDLVTAYQNLALALIQLEDAATAAAAAPADAVTAAAAAARQRLTRDPADLAALIRLAPLLERLGDTAAALACWRRVAALRPEHALATTRAAVLTLRRHLGPPPSPTGHDGRPLAAMTSLGANGRFGNQVIQYGFLRCYAEHHGYAAATGDWIGRDLFGLTDLLLPMPETVASTPLTELCDTDLATAQQAAGDPWLALPDRNFTGLFANQRHYLAAHQPLFRRCLSPAPAIADRLDPAVARLRGDGTLVALHLRRGDATRFPRSHPFQRHFWIAPEDWYLAWLQTLWPLLPRPVLYIASDDPAIAGRFAAFRPYSAADLAVGLPGAEFYVDFHLLTRADVLAGSNSTFSTAAALLNARAQLFLRPDRTLGSLAPYQPWDAGLLPGD